MGTTAEKLQNIINAKADIGAAIVEKGGSVPAKFIDYGKAIRALPAGGGTSAADELWGAPADPYKVYAATRPENWMPMPEPQPLEIYFLFEIPAEGSAAIALKSTTTDETYEISVGHMTDGAYVPKNTYQIAKGATWEAELAAADYPEFPSIDPDTGEATVQVLIRMKFMENCNTVNVTKHPQNPGRNCNILEVNGHLGEQGNLGVLGTAGSENGSLRKLKYYKMQASNKAPLARMFRKCSRLVAVLSTGWSSGFTTAPVFFFGECSSLLAYPVSEIFFSTSTNDAQRNGANGLFYGCFSLSGVDDAAVGASARQQFYYKCVSLSRIKNLDLSWGGNANKCFYGCTSLAEIENVIVGDRTAIANSMTLCGPSGLPRLRKLTFAQREEPWTKPSNFNIGRCAFTRAGLVECFASLPALAEGKTASISVYGNPGTADLTAADIAIATAKGWTVVTEEPATTAEEGS